MIKHGAYTPQTSTLPGVDSPDETGEVARVSATKGGRAVEPASLRSQRQKNKPHFLLRGKWHEVPIGDKKHVILSVSEISHDLSEQVYASSVLQGDRHACGYSALNADALKLSFFAFFIKNASAL